MPFYIIRKDITLMEVDAIVNAANRDLQMGGGVCGSIFKKAGAQKLQETCDKLAPIETGEAVITPGFDLPAKHIIHAAGPIYDPKDPQTSAQLLSSTYLSAMKLAIEQGLESIAFPLISSGIYGYPKQDALKVAKDTIQNFLENNDLSVYLVLFDGTPVPANQRLLSDIKHYLKRYFEDKSFPLINVYQALSKLENLERDHIHPKMGAPYHDKGIKEKDIDEILNELDEPFSTSLLRLIDAKGKTDVEVYKRANIDRKLFSKIRSSEQYTPSKRTALALAVGLELSLEETDALLKKAGYTLSRSQKSDVIIEYFIINRNYDIYQINEALYAYDQAMLGS